MAKGRERMDISINTIARLKRGETLQHRTPAAIRDVPAMLIGEQLGTERWIGSPTIKPGGSDLVETARPFRLDRASL